MKSCLYIYWDGYGGNCDTLFLTLKRGKLLGFVYMMENVVYELEFSSKVHDL